MPPPENEDGVTRVAAQITPEKNKGNTTRSSCERQNHPNSMTSQEIGSLAGALAKAQGEMNAAPKTAKNPFFKSRYSDLSTVWSSIRKPLAKNNLAIVQSVFCDEGQMVLTTRLVHSSGQWAVSHYPVVPQKRDPQGYGSALTYARRYALSAMVGVVCEEDDDGEAAMSRKQSPQPEPTVSKDKLVTLEIPPSKKKLVTDYLKGVGWIENSLDELTNQQRAKVRDGLDSLIKKAQQKQKA